MTEVALMEVPRQQMERDSFLPAMTIGDAVARRHALVEFTKSQMEKDRDFGIIPGTPKPTLLKPGAEKLCTLFGLSQKFQLMEQIQDWTGAAFNGEPFFYYRYRCQLFRGDLLITEAEASCNSFEEKYRFRDAKRACPNCGLDTIFKGKDPGSGWYCWAKKGGCGAKFGEKDSGITGQKVGRAINPQIFDQVNTLQKMAQKRALIAATLQGVNASEFFTQDLEEITIPLKPTTDEEPLTPVAPSFPKPTHTPSASPRPSEGQQIASTAISNPRATTVEDMVTPRQLVALNALAKTFSLNLTDECQKVYGCEQKELSRTAASEFIEQLKGYGKEAQPATQPEVKPESGKKKTELTREQLLSEIKRGRRKFEKVMSAEKGDDSDLPQLSDDELKTQYRELGKAIHNSLKSQIADICNAIKDYNPDYKLPGLESKTVQQLQDLKEVCLAELNKERASRYF